MFLIKGRKTKYRRGMYISNSRLKADEMIFIQRKQCKGHLESYSLSHLELLHSQTPWGIRHRGYRKVI